MNNKSKKTSATRSDDYPEFTQKDLACAVKRKGLKKQSAEKSTDEVLYELRLEDFDQHFESLARCLESKNK